MVATNLKLNALDKKCFCESAIAKHSRSEKRRRLAKANLSKLLKKRESKVIEEKYLNHLSKWYTHAALELLSNQEYQENTDLIAEKLEISKISLKKSIESLLEANLLEEKDGKFLPCFSKTSTGSDIPNKVLRNVTKEFIDKGKESLEKDPVDIREFLHLLLKLTQKTYLQIKEELRKIRRKFCNEIKNKKEFAII